jgi:hypothetical protein
MLGLFVLRVLRISLLMRCAKQFEELKAVKLMPILGAG